MEVVLQTIGGITLGLGLGYYLHRRYSNHASPLQSVIQMFLALMWIAAAIVTIATGYMIAGVVILGLFFYFFLGNYQNVQQSDLPSDRQSIRRRLSNWEPPGVDRRS